MDETALATLNAAPATSIPTAIVQKSDHKGVELRECYAANGDSWTNATVRDCQHFAVDEAGGAITAPRGRLAARHPRRVDARAAPPVRTAAPFPARVL